MGDKLIGFFDQNQEVIVMLLETDDFGCSGEGGEFPGKVEFEVVDLQIGDGKDVELLLWEIILYYNATGAVLFGPLQTDSTFEAPGRKRTHGWDRSKAGLVKGKNFIIY